MLDFVPSKSVDKIEVVAFNFATVLEAVDTSTALFDIAYELHLNSWNGREKLELKLIDISLANANLNV